MANHCWNWIQFSGKGKKGCKSLNKLVDRMKTYEETDYLAEWGDYILDKGKIGDSIEILNKRHDNNCGYVYGSRWFDFNIDDDIQGEHPIITILGDSAWSPMCPLVGEICKHYGLSGEIEYEEPGCDFAGRQAFNDKGILIENIDVTYHEWRYIDDRRYWFEDVRYGYEGCDDEDCTIEQLTKDHSYASESDIKELRELILDMNAETLKEQQNES